MAETLGNKTASWIAMAVLLFLFSMRMIMADRNTDMSDSHKLQVHKLLKKLNKPAVKTIQSPDGDTIDCVSIQDQPALDHPKLKNHKIKMRPNFQVHDKIFEESNEMSSKSMSIVQLWHQRGTCPDGTIPIRRTKEEDILRASCVQQFGKKTHSKGEDKFFPNVEGLSGSEFASVFVGEDNYYGGKATMNVWNPIVEQSQEYSVSSIWVENVDDSENIEVIQAGWQVNPQLYGDNQTRLFSFWTSDSHKKTGCFDILCSGFVQVYSGLALGSSIKPVSVYDDTDFQYEITITIWKDKGSGDWWMQYGADKIMGYWPSTLFSSSGLSKRATIIEWGGEVGNSGYDIPLQHTTTQMGSGHFAGQLYGKASYFKNIKFVNGDNEMVTAHYLEPCVDNSNCYNVLLPDIFLGNSWDSYFYFGGPGRNPDCP